MADIENALKARAARSGAGVAEMLAEDRRALLVSPYPTSECYRPHEVEMFACGDLPERRMRHADACRPCAALLEVARPRRNAQPVKSRVAVLISGRGSNMAALIGAAAEDGYPAEIVLVISNVAGAGGVDLARCLGVATETVESRPFGKDRAAFEAALQARLDAHHIDIVCLGGFMRLLTAEFVGRWRGRMLNIHPSLLPAFPGLDPHGQALRAGVEVSGATVHFVVPETDAGPILVQEAVPVLPGDTAQSLADRVLAVEHRIYPEALRMLASGAARFDGDRRLPVG